MPRLRSKPTRLAWFALGMTLIVGALTLTLKPTEIRPFIQAIDEDGLKISYINSLETSKSACIAKIEAAEKILHTLCPKCKISQHECHNSTPEELESYLSDSASPNPSGHLPNGVLVFESENSNHALQKCNAWIENYNKSHSTKASETCFAGGVKKEFFRARTDWVNWTQFGFAILALILTQLVSKITCFLIIRYEHLHAHLSHDHSDAGPQKFHAIPTPRIGGIPLMAGLLVSAALLHALPNQFSDGEFGTLILAALPAFLGGLTEDVTKKVGVSQRLALTILSGMFGSLLLGATITRVEIPGLDELLAWTPIALLFTAIAVGGVANSINIIDGYNGLASGFGIIASLAFAFVSAQNGDSMLLYANLSMAGVLIGFLVWNWPGGKIFLGDGGAYLLGFWLAEISILITVRNPGVSVWFSLAVMIYPVFETIYSIYRRKIKNNKNPGHPDANHLHQMIYKRLVRIHVGSRDPKQKTMRNSRVSFYIWAAVSAFTITASAFSTNPMLMQIICAVFCVCYVVTYRSLSSWKPPTLLRMTRMSS